MAADSAAKAGRLHRRQVLLGGAALGLAGCVGTRGPAPLTTAPPHVVVRYGVIQDGQFRIPAVPPQLLNIRTYRVVVAYTGPEAPGSVVVDPYARFLYFVTGPQRAYRYGIAVGRAGTSFAGSAVVRRKVRWPAWTPTRSMIRAHPEMYSRYARGIPGGPSNPLGARALYLYHGGKDTFFRIHGTNDVRSIGHATSAGCIRLFNQDILDLYDRAPLGTPVKVRTRSQSRLYEGVLKERADGMLEQLEPPVIWPEGD